MSEDNKHVKNAKNKEEHDRMIDEWPGLSIVDYFTPSWRPFTEMD